MSNDSNWNPDDKMDIEDLSKFTNVANLAHLTNSNPQSIPKKTPPPPPPPRHSTTNSNDNFNDPPQYVSFNNNDENGMDISLDEDIRDKISHYSGYGQGSYNDQYNNGDEQIDDDDSEYNENKIDIYTDIERMIKVERNDDKQLSVILPLRYDLYESYFAPLLMVFAQIPAFHNIVLNHEYLTFPYKPNWWNRELCSENPLFVQEIQRLVGFLNSNSKRKFASLFNLIKPFEKLVRDEYESIDEFINFSINQIIASISSTDFNSKNGIEKLFTSTCVYSEDLDNERKIYCIPFTNDDLYYNIYQTIYCKLNMEDGDLYFQNISDVLTFSFESDTKTIDEGFLLDEFIFPQIFLHENKDILSLVNKKIEEMRIKHKELMDKSFKLRAFNGKSVRNILTETKQYLYLESEKRKNSDEKNDSGNANENENEQYALASQNIASLANNIEKLTMEITEEANNLQRNISVLKSKKFDIDEILNDEMKLSFEPWMLTGIIINPAMFFYRNKKSNEWISIDINQETCKDYSSSIIELNEIQEMMKEYTSNNLEDGFILTYVKKSVFFEEGFNPVNKIVQEFIDKDNAQLERQYEIIKQGSVDV